MANSSRNLGVEIAAALRGAGYLVYFVGGCVRDRLLGLPSEDYDLVTDAIPTQLLELFPGAKHVGAHFGVVELRSAGAAVQVATFRTDHAYSDGRRPEGVTFVSSPEEDVRRRDFTINALLEDPFTGDVTDFVGGRSDLTARVIRAIGDPDRRFEEDHLRLLRAVRFAARFNFDIEPATFSAIQRHAPSIHRIAIERVSDELTRILTEGGARRGFELLDASGLLAGLLPEIAAMKGVPQPPEFHPEGDVWTHTLLLLEQLPAGVSPSLALAALLHDVGKPVTISHEDRIRFNGHAEVGARMARDILTRLRYPTAVIDSVASLTANHMRFLDLPRMGDGAFKRLLRLPGFEEQAQLFRMDLLASMRPEDDYLEMIRRRDALPPESVHPQPLLTGRDLISLGYTPGPVMGEILEALENQQLDGHIEGREQALAFVKSRFPRS